jgi:hypothetical protein
MQTKPPLKSLSTIQIFQNTEQNIKYQVKKYIKSPLGAPQATPLLGNATLNCDL